MTAAPILAAPDLPELLKRRDLTTGEVAHLPEDLHYELIDGRLVLSPSPLLIHQSIISDVVLACKERRPPGVVIGFDQSVWIDGHNERRPDVVAVFVEGASVSPILVTDVLLAVEIVSESSRETDRTEKRELYASSGIPHYWIIDPLADRVTLTEFMLGPDGRYHQLATTDGVAELKSPWEITVDLPAMTEERNLFRRARRVR